MLSSTFFSLNLSDRLAVDHTSELSILKINKLEGNIHLLPTGATAAGGTFNN
jgi:hypothetical protein